MSSKKISFLEQNCEKLLTAGAGVALAGVVVWQLVFAQVRVDAGGESLSIEELGDRVGKRTESFNAKLDGDSGVTLPDRAKVTGVKSLAAKIVEPISPAPTLPPNQPALGRGISRQGIEADEWYYEPQFAAVQVDGAVVTADALTADAIDEETLAKFPDLAARFPEGSARDVTWATPWATVDLAGLRAELRKELRSANPPLAPLPSLWFNDTLYMVDVVFERQMREKNGSWGAATEVAPVPGQDSWRTDIVQARSGTRETIFKNLAEYDQQIAVLQPEFLATKNDKFVAPGSGDGTPDVMAAAGLSEAEKAKRAAKRKLDDRQRALDRMRAQLEKLGGPLEPPAAGGGGAGGGFGAPQGGGSKGSGEGGGGDGGGGPGGGLGGGGGFKGRNDPNNPKGKDDEATKGQRIRLTRQLKRSEGELAKEEDAFRKAYPDAAPANVPVKGAQADVPKLADQEAVLAWTHDWKVEPGTTYRYRCVVQCYNPFFSRKALLVPPQQPLADAFVRSTATSAWGPAITIPDPTMFFVLRASGADGAASARRATIELYRYLDGVIDRQVASCSPGDPVGKADDADPASVNFETPWYVVDIFDDAARDGDRGGRRNTIVVLERTDGSGQLVREYRQVDRDSASPERNSLEAEFLNRTKASGEKGTPPDSANSGAPGAGGKPSGPGGSGLGS